MATDETDDGFEEWWKRRTSGMPVAHTPIRYRPWMYDAYHARDAEIAEKDAEIERLKKRIAELELNTGR